MNSTFEEQLRELINRHSKENGSDTPDFVIAEYLSACLNSFNAAVKARDILKPSGKEFVKQQEDRMREELKAPPKKYGNMIYPEISKHLPSAQIVAYRHHGIIYRKSSWGEFIASGASISQLILHPEDMKEIYTVRNSSGGEFSAGDETNFGKIQYFKVIGENIMADCEETSHTFRNINNLTKPKRTPILTVEGKELFLADEVWYVRTDFSMGSVQICNGFERLEGFHYFLTKKSAERWIAENGPSISYKQLVDYFVTMPFHFIEGPGMSGIKTGDFLHHFRPKG